MWWCVPVISATQEAEAGELLALLAGGGCGEPRSCHGTPAWVTEQDHVSKKTKKKRFWGEHPQQKAQQVQRPWGRKELGVLEEQQ